MKKFKQIAVIGAGFAGMSTAVELAQAGYQVAVFEAGRVAGGRARRVMHNGLALDNGQHIAVGAYQALLAMQRKLGINPEQTFIRLPLDLDLWHGPAQTFQLRCPRLPAPLHSAYALLQAHGLSWAERWAASRAMLKARFSGWQLASDCSVADWAQTHGQSPRLLRCLWEPLTLAALNTPVDKASAQVLLNVLRDSLAGPRAASDFLLPTQDLSALLPEAAARYIEAHGGTMHYGHMVKRLSRRQEHWYLDDHPQAFDALVIALPPHRLHMLEDHCPALHSALAQIAHWQWQPIYTLYAQYAEASRLSKPMLGLIHSTSQWLLDRGQLTGQKGLIAAVISGEGEHTRLSQEDLSTQVLAEIAHSQPHLGAPLWHKLIAEKRATFACAPGLSRPPNATPDPSIWLAGDYTAGPYPATLEGAVRSGVAAAQAIKSLSLSSTHQTS